MCRVYILYIIYIYNSRAYHSLQPVFLCFPAEVVGIPMRDLCMQPELVELLLDKNALST